MTMRLAAVVAAVAMSGCTLIAPATVATTKQHDSHDADVIGEALLLDLTILGAIGAMEYHPPAMGSGSATH